MLAFLLMLFTLVIAHYIADFPLQGDFLAKGKNKYNPIPGVPWYHCMTAHSMIHAGFVWFLTADPLIGLFEFVTHFRTDSKKCKGNISFTEDQALHIFFKFLWAAMWMWERYLISKYQFKTVY